MNCPILIVDDDSQIRSLIGAVLRKHGFQIREAVDGVAGLSAVREMEGAISLLVTDHFMPGLDGAALARHVKALFPTIPVILMSSEPMQCDDHCADISLQAIHSFRAS